MIAAAEAMDRGADRRRAAIAAVRQGRATDSLALCRAELATADGEAGWSELIVEAMQARDLTFAGELAAVLAAVQRGALPPSAAPVTTPPGAQLSLPKLRHDLAQLRYLRGRGLGDAELEALADGYVAVLARHAGRSDDAKFPLTPDDAQAIGRGYGRLVHVASARRLAAALSPTWDRAAVQHDYRTRRPGVVVIDDFLTAEALARLHDFCLESTIWSGNRYAHGRLGSLFFNGFNCPLLMQISEEIRDAFPAVIDGRYPLRQLWGFKNTCELPADSTIHADFAAVNVNFWITPTAANLDDASGGMVIYDADAPRSWDFTAYNERQDVIQRYLEARRPRVIRVPYRQNRAVIFNSDLFHATEAVRFRPDYASHRINVTMLYGERNHDAHHPPSDVAADHGAWRSAAFSRRRR